MKTCPRCQRNLPVDRAHFGRHPGTIDGFNGICRECKKAARNLRNAGQRPKVNKKQQIWRSKLPFEKAEKVRHRARKWYDDNCARARATVKARTERAREEMLVAYGALCACCGEHEPKFLTIDHIENDGAQHRREIGGTSSSLVFYLQKRGWPKDRYRLLCFNCNCGRQRNGGICPHEIRQAQFACETPDFDQQAAA